MKFDMLTYLSLVTFSPIPEWGYNGYSFIHTMPDVGYPKGDW
ncbi:hypothetical protein TNCV_3892661, partial [Trichonephila clavipes]